MKVRFTNDDYLVLEAQSALDNATLLAVTRDAKLTMTIDGDTLAAMAKAPVAGPASRVHQRGKPRTDPNAMYANVTGQERLDMIKELRASGERVEDIAPKFGLRKNSIYSMLSAARRRHQKHLTNSRRKRRHTPTPQDVDTFMAMRNEEFNFSEIGRRTGFSGSTVTRYVNQRLEEMTRPGAGAGAPKPVASQEVV